MGYEDYAYLEQISDLLYEIRLRTGTRHERIVPHYSRACRWTGNPRWSEIRAHLPELTEIAFLVLRLALTRRNFDSLWFPLVGQSTAPRPHEILSSR